jgi:uncharacterized SAM-binding protein YcdF (DUF218 family)
VARPKQAQAREVADVAVVLGAAVLAGGQPSASLARRVRHAARLWRDGTVAYLLLTGGVGRHPPAEAEVMRRLAEREGVEPSRIVLEGHATTTLESAAYCAPIIATHGWRRVVLVTDRYHLPRALMAFRSRGVEVSGSAPPDGRGAMPRWQWAAMHVRELAALPWYLLRTTRRR